MKSIKIFILILVILTIATCHKSHSKHQGKEKTSVFVALKKENNPAGFLKSLESQAEQMIRNRKKTSRFLERGTTFYKGKNKKINSTATEKPEKPKENPKFAFKNGNELILKQDLNITLPNANFTLTTSQLKDAFALLSNLKVACGEKLEKCNLGQMSKLRFSRIIPSANYTTETKEKPLNLTNITNKTLSPRDHLQRFGKKLLAAKKPKKEVKWEKPIILHRFMEKQYEDPYSADRTELEHYGHVAGNEDSVGYGEMVDPSSADDDDKSGIKATIAAVEKDENDLFNEGESNTESMSDSSSGSSTNFGERDAAATIAEDHTVNGPTGEGPQGFGDGPAI